MGKRSRPKGSKNHPKYALHRPKQATKQPQLAQNETFCSICDRLAFGLLVPLGHDKWRHDGCVLGSDEWREYYLRLSYNERVPLGEFYNHTYTEET